ncbi:MAG: hypothetical protein J5736_03400, partial [Bacilli bacterium]|nr:hypothetical protein [Bacilli bacterium]
VVYGEGWAGSPSGDTGMMPQEGNYVAKTDEVYAHLGENGKGSVGCFNDRFRDGVKGNCQNSGGQTAEVPDWGFVSKGPSDINNEIKARVGEGLLGQNVNDKDNHRGCARGDKQNPAQTVSYVACHDNYTLYDQLNYAINFLDGNGKKADIDDTTGEVFDAAVASMATCFLNQGIAFLNGGDEIFRQKVMKPDDPMYAKLVESYKQGSYDHGNGQIDYWWEGDGYAMESGNWLVRNSYQYGDAVNSFKWDRKAKYFEYYQKVVEVSELRNSLMANLFGRSKADVAAGKCNVFGSTYDSGTSPLVACFLGGRDNTNYYLLFGGRMSEQYTSLTCGNCSIEVVYSSPIHTLRPEAHYAGQVFDVTNNLLGAAKYEVMLVKVS